MNLEWVDTWEVALHTAGQRLAYLNYIVGALIGHVTEDDAKRICAAAALFATEGKRPKQRAVRVRGGAFATYRVAGNGRRPRPLGDTL